MIMIIKQKEKPYIHFLWLSGISESKLCSIYHEELGLSSIVPSVEAQDRSLLHDLVVQNRLCFNKYRILH